MTRTSQTESGESAPGATDQAVLEVRRPRERGRNPSRASPAQPQNGTYANSLRVRPGHFTRPSALLPLTPPGSDSPRHRRLMRCKRTARSGLRVVVFSGLGGVDSRAATDGEPGKGPSRTRPPPCPRPKAIERFRPPHEPMPDSVARCLLWSRRWPHSVRIFQVCVGPWCSPEPAALGPPSACNLRMI